MIEPLRLSPAAAVAYRQAGWTVTDNNIPDPGVTTGPCAACRQPCTRYGPAGAPHCPTCQPATKETT